MMQVAYHIVVQAPLTPLHDIQRREFGIIKVAPQGDHSFMNDVVFGLKNGDVCDLTQGKIILNKSQEQSEKILFTPMMAGDEVTFRF